MQKKSRAKALLVLAWTVLLLVAFSVWKKSDISLTDVPELLQAWLVEFGFFKAVLIYIVLYTIRPIIFFPGSWLSIASGVIFGPWFGVLFTLIGGNLSAIFAFLIARHLGRDWVKSKETGVVKKWDHRLCQNGIVTVMIMRLLYLPYDGVNYGCGLTSMKLRDFIIGTFIGIIPGTTTFVLLGGTASSQAGGMITLLGVDVSRRLFVFLLSVFFFALGLAIAKLIRRLVPETCEA